MFIFLETISKHSKSKKKTQSNELNDFIKTLEKTFPVIDYINDGYYHNLKLDDNEIAIEILFSGIKFETELYKLNNQLKV